MACRVQDAPTINVIGKKEVVTFSISTTSFPASIFSLFFCVCSDLEIIVACFFLSSNHFSKKMTNYVRTKSLVLLQDINLFLEEKRSYVSKLMRQFTLLLCCRFACLPIWIRICAVINIITNFLTVF